jgi:hypothetical protein
MPEPTLTDFLHKLSLANDETRLKLIDLIASKRLTPAIIHHAEVLMQQHAQRPAAADGGDEGGGDIFKSCAYCNNDANWDYPGGDIARWVYCGPLGLGCMA